MGFSFLITSSCSAPFRVFTSLPIRLQKASTFSLDGFISNLRSQKSGIEPQEVEAIFHWRDVRLRAC